MGVLSNETAVSHSITFLEFMIVYICSLSLILIHLLKKRQHQQVSIWHFNTELPKSAVALSRQGRRRKRKPWWFEDITRYYLENDFVNHTSGCG